MKFNLQYQYEENKTTTFEGKQHTKSKLGIQDKIIE